MVIPLKTHNGEAGAPGSNAPEIQRGNTDVRIREFRRQTADQAN